MPADRRARLLEGPVGTTLVRLALPMMIGNLLQTGYQLTDAFWVGRLGAAAVAAVTVSFPVMFLVIAAGAGLAMAGATLAAQYVGAGEADKVNHVAGQTMMMVALTSIVFGAAGFLLSPAILRLIGVAPEVYDSALGFMRVSFAGILFVFLYAMFQALMRSVGQTRIPVLIVLGTVILNFALDPLFIFGWGPVPPLGVMGAALATLTTQGLASALGILVLMRGRHGIALTLRSFRPDLPYIRRAFLLGLPASVELATRGLAPMALSYLAAGLGTLTIAAYGVGTSILQFVTIPAMSLSMAVATLVGQSIGAGRPERARYATVLGGAAGFAVLSLAGVVAYIFAEALVAFFVPRDPVVIAEGAHFIRVMCLTWGAIGIQLAVAAAFRAAGNMLAAMVLALATQWALQIPLAYVLVEAAGMHAAGLWWSFGVANVAGAIASVWLFAAQSPQPAGDALPAEAGSR